MRIIKRELRVKHSISKLKLAVIASLFSIGTLANSSNAQTSVNSPNMSPANFGGTVSSPDQCAAACGSNSMCASWTFRPNAPLRGAQPSGQCQFSTNSNVQNAPNLVSGRPAANQAPAMQTSANSNARSATSANVPSWNAPNTRSGGNYGVTPLPNYAAPRARIAQNTNSAPPIPRPSQNAAPMANNGASISFERPNTSANNNVAATPPSTAPTSSQLVWQPAAQNAPPMPSAAPAANPNLNAYRAPDGTVDAAQMRRDQLASQNRNSQPHYSVQSEWSGVAQAQATGQNQSNVNWANTTPVAMPRENNSQEQATAPTTTNSRGPLRSGRNAARSSQEQSDANEGGFWGGLGKLFSRNDQDNSPATQSEVNEGQSVAMHGPLRKRAQAR